jgi:hypothetical protein
MSVVGPESCAHCQIWFTIDGSNPATSDTSTKYQDALHFGEKNETILLMAVTLGSARTASDLTSRQLVFELPPSQPLPLLAALRITGAFTSSIAVIALSIFICLRDMIPRSPVLTHS